MIIANLRRQSFLWGAILCLACGNGGQAPEVQSVSRGRVEGDGTRREGATGEGRLSERAKPSAAVGRTEVGEESGSHPGNALPELALKLDFAAKLSRAHLRSNGLLIDFGTPARNKHTLGDWKSGFQGNYTENGTTFSGIAANRAHVFFDIFPGEKGGGVVEFRGRAEGSSKVTVRLNGEGIGVVEFPRGEFGHASLRVKDGFIPGQNYLTLDCPRRRKTAGGRSYSIELDYVRITSDIEGQGPAAASFDAPKYQNQAGGPHGILLSPAESLTYYTIPSKGARVRGRARARLNGSRANFAISVAQHGEEREPLMERQLTDRTSQVDVDLDSFAEKMVSITVEATGGEVVLESLGLWEPMGRHRRAPGQLRAKNIVLVLIDTLRADKLAIYNGATRVRTPYLDGLGKEAMVFMSNWSPENWTKPSIASLLSGLWPETHRTQDDRAMVPKSVVLASEHFKSMGFTTAGFVANGYVSGKFGFQKGWDQWVNYVREGKRNRAQYVVDDVIAWLEQRDKDKPFFLYVHTIDPHVPYIPPNEYWSLYDPAPYKGPVKPTGTAQLLEQVKTGKIELSRRDKFRLEALYDGEITYHDDHLVRLHEALKTSGLLGDTVLIVTSDHGEEFFEHGLVGHGHNLHDELIQVPLIVRLPNGSKPATTPRDPGAVSHHPSSLVDIFPTMCDLVSIVCPEGVEGTSLLPVLKGESDDTDSKIRVSYFLGGQRAVRMGRFKAIYKGLWPEVYDLKTDPLETDDIHKQDSTVLAGLRDALGEHLGRFVPKAQVAETGAKEKHTNEKAVIDPETKRQLKALGYLGGE